MAEKRVAKEGCMDVQVCHFWRPKCLTFVDDGVAERAKVGFETVGN
ncbi:MAG: hypothetical protein ISQ06_15075 [Planctomycetaceae bacterium]|nr:hypothetical protein [Planctomycetaceae bacterium]